MWRALLLLLVVAACQAAPVGPLARPPASAPRPPPVAIEVAPPPDETPALLLQAVSELLAGEVSPAAARLEAEYADHPRLGMIRALRERLRRAAELRKRYDQLETQRLICVAERDRLVDQQTVLMRGLEDLKRLTIEMETRRK